MRIETGCRCPHDHPQQNHTCGTPIAPSCHTRSPKLPGTFAAEPLRRAAIHVVTSHRSGPLVASLPRSAPAPERPMVPWDASGPAPHTGRGPRRANLTERMRLPLASCPQKHGGPEGTEQEDEEVSFFGGSERSARAPGKQLRGAPRARALNQLAHGLCHGKAARRTRRHAWRRPRPALPLV